LTGFEPPSGPPTVGEPAWLPDPTRRHQLRWFDGTSFTDQVADGTFRATDPGGPVPQGPGGGAPVAAGKPSKQRRLPLVLVGIGVGAVLGGGAYLLLADDDSGFGSFEGTVGDEPGRHEISLSGGSAAVVSLDPSSDFDAVVAFEVSGDDADRIGEVFEDTPFADEAAADRDQLFRVDVGFDGDDERTFLAVPFGVHATVVVSGFEGSEGDYEIDIEKVDLDGIDEDADGDDVLDALVDADIPSTLRQDIENRLAE
jgi:hypothetical protein